MRMHELGITQSIVDIAVRTAREQGATRVRSVTVEIGELAGVVADAVAFCYEACRQGTLLEGAELIIETIPGQARCSSCGSETPVDRYTFACPACGAFALERLQGEELQIREMEID
nr:hydrogenase maturation nickel metallochaperone HypA [Desulfuromonas sp. DDH964]